MEALPTHKRTRSMLHSVRHANERTRRLSQTDDTAVVNRACLAPLKDTRTIMCHLTFDQTYLENCPGINSCQLSRLLEVVRRASVSS